MPIHSWNDITTGIENESVVGRGGGWGEGVTFIKREHDRGFWGDRTVLYRDYGDVMWIYHMLEV